MTVSMSGICKSYGSHRVLDRIDFEFRGGEICALLGENGAGKSTLMNVLCGVVRPDEGKIRLDGKTVSFNTPAQALHSGIAMIHQELSLVNHLNIYENLFLGHELRRNGLLDRKTMIGKTRDIFGQMEVDLDPLTKVSSLDASCKQIVEIARALLMNASVLIMDEPTAALSGGEIRHIFKLMRALKQKGVAFVFISHKLREVMEICDCYVVLRNGERVGGGRIEQTTQDQIVIEMVGHGIRKGAAAADNSGDELIRLENLTLEPYYRNISFRIRTGEIAGFVGLLGDGRSELFRTVFGDLTQQSGKIYWQGHELKRLNISKALKAGIGYVPKDRKENGILKDMSILDNASITILPKLTKFGLIRKRVQHRIFRTQREQLQIKMNSESERITSLSGGNQQKVILARWLADRPKLLILDNPTQGVDVAAKEEIYEIIKQVAEQGVAVVILSNEAQEIIRTCGTAAVLFHGDMQGVLTNDRMTEQEIMRLATGGK